MSDEADKKRALKQIADALKALDDKRRYNKIETFSPYPKQQEFFDLGATKRERMFSAGNQLGKSEAGAVEMTYHLTGNYPSDWFGRRWDRPIKAWAAGADAKVVRKVQQNKLFGEPGLKVAFGSGFIPKRLVVGDPSSARGIGDAYDTVHIKHASGGTSVLSFLSYEAGREKFQGDTVDLVWFDEEPDLEIYTEGLTRTNAVKGMVYVTFTPLKGRTPLYERFTTDTKPSRGFVNMTIMDVPMTDEERQLIIEGYAPHERKARTLGYPAMGEGAVFTTPEDHISEPTLTYIPPHWSKLWSIDFGIGHPFAAVLSAWDRDNDVIHVLEAWRIADQTPVQHAVRMRQEGITVPVAWPQDGTAREKSGETVINLYKAQGLSVCPQHATFEDGGYGTEAGILEMDERMKTGRLRVNAALSEWFEEYRGYHRKKGLIVKERDDIMSATRIGVMAKRFGRSGALGGARSKNRQQSFARDIDFDPF